jgi:putative hydrolase of the HAD superfamily
MVAAWFAAEERHFPAWRACQITFAEQRRRRLRDFLPLLGITPGNDASLDDVFVGYLRGYEASWTKSDDVDAAFAALAENNLKTAILSNRTVEQQNAKIMALGLSGRVGPVFAAEGLGEAKPAPSSYLMVCTQLGSSPATLCTSAISTTSTSSHPAQQDFKRYTSTAQTADPTRNPNASHP